MELKRNFVVRLNKLIVENDVTAEELSAEIDIGLPVCIQMMRGVTMPKATTLCRIADYFGCSIDYLLGRSEVYSVV